MADLGRAALLVAFGLALYAAVAGSLAAHRGRRRLHESARNALVGTFAATAVAALVLLNAFQAPHAKQAYAVRAIGTWM